MNNQSPNATNEMTVGMTRRGFFESVAKASAAYSVGAGVPLACAVEPAGGQTGKSGELFEGDGFAAPVQISSKRQPLSELLASLTLPTSYPRVTAAREAADEAMTVFASGVPIRKVLKGVAALLRYTWTKDTDAAGAPEYRLVAGTKIRNYENSLFRQTLERGAERLFALLRYLQVPEEQMKKLNDDFWAKKKIPDPFLTNHDLFYLSRGGPRAILNLVGALTPDQRWTLLNDGQLLLNVGNMTEREQRIALNLGFNMDQLLQRIGKTSQDEQNPATESLRRLLALKLDVDQNPVTLQILGCGCGMPGVSPLAAMSSYGTPPPPDLLPLRGRPYWDWAEEDKGLYTALNRMAFPRVAAEALAKRPSWSESLRVLSRSINMPILSDDYAAYASPGYRHSRFLGYMGEPLPPPPNLKTMQLAEGLDALCNDHRRLWWIEDGMLLFRSRTWFIERQYEVPASVRTLLQKQLADHEQLNGDAVAALGTLSARQLQGLDISSLPDVIAPNVTPPWGDRANRPQLALRDLLLIFRSLDAARRIQALQLEGLSISDMPSNLAERYVQILATTVGTKVLNDTGSLRFIIRHTLPRGTEDSRRKLVELLIAIDTTRVACNGVYISFTPKNAPQ
jgi:hypothetical protein